MVWSESENQANRRGREVWVWGREKGAGWDAGCGR